MPQDQPGPGSPQALPGWARPAPEPDGPFSQSPREQREQRATDRTRDDHTGPAYETGPDPIGPAPSVIWPPPGEDCGECDVSGLTLVIDGETVDCDDDPETCALVCCTFPAPDQCAPAYSEGPCAIPLSGEWILVFVAVAVGVWKLRS
jgi:hypothetical protein